MFARVVTFTGASDIDAGIDFVRTTVTPLLRQQKGYRNATASADRASGVFGVLTEWTTQAELEASESALAKVREEGQRIIGGQFSVEVFEEVLVEMLAPPSVGSALLVRRLSMDPARIDDNLEFFTREVLPQIKAEPGLIAIRQLINRDTGEAIVGTVWKDVASMDAAAESASRRQAAAADRVTFASQSRREVVFIDVV